MHPKILERRNAILSKCIYDVDLELKKVSTSIARRVRLVGSLCVGQEEAEILERQVQVGVDYVIKIPATSEEGIHARRELIEKLTELETYLDSLLHAPWVKSDFIAKRR